MAHLPTFEHLIQMMRDGRHIVKGGKPVVSKWLGSLDPTYLNERLDHFNGMHLFLKLVATYAVVTMDWDLDISTLDRRISFTENELSQLEWNFSKGFWAKSLVILQDPDAFKSGPDGYVKFARVYANGNMSWAYLYAKSLLPIKKFESLDWGPKVIATITEYIKIKKILFRKTSFRIYKGRAGLKRFANQYVDQDIEKTLNMAKIILPPEMMAEFNWLPLDGDL